MNNILHFSDFFNLDETIATDIFSGVEYPWEILPKLSEFIVRLGKTLPSEKYYLFGENIWVAKSAIVAKSASLTGPLIVDENAEIRHCAFIRGSAIVGKNAVVGNSTELKNSVLFNGVQIPHYNYVGDSILGFKTHLGAGCITSNVKSDKTPVVAEFAGLKIKTGLKKLGAIVGDCVEVGCNSVLNPGTVIGKNTSIYPLSCVRGFVPQNSIFKCQSQVVTKKI